MPEASRLPAPRHIRLAPVAPVVASALFSTWFVARRSFRIDGELYFSLFDDAMVSMRYARNLAEGHGLVWNPGEPAVEGFSNLLWTLWMALLHVPPVPQSKVSLLVAVSGAGLLAANVWVVGRLARRVTPGSAAAPLIAMWVTALYFPLCFWSLRGMEVGLLALLTSLAVLLAAGDQDRAPPLAPLGAVLVLGVMTRSDFMVTALMVVGVTATRSKPADRLRVVVALGVPLLVTLAGTTLFRVLYYGDPLPNTWYLKVDQIPLGTRVERGVSGLATILLVELAPLVALGVAGFLARKWRDHGGASLVAAVVLAQCAYHVFVGGDAWEVTEFANRFLAPVVPLIAVMAAVAISEMTVEPGTRTLRMRVGLAVGLLAVALVRLADVRPGARFQFDGRPDGGSLVGRVLPPLAIVVLIVALPRLARVVAATRRPWAVVAVVVPVLVFATVGRPFDRWRRDSASPRFDAMLTRYGVDIREATGETATIAVPAAGAISYFSERRSIDMLGRSDRVIARSAPRDTFIPGHDKWDYGHSVGALRPDVVAGLWRPTPADLAALEEWGYEPVSSEVYLRSDSPLVDRAAMRRAVARTDRER